MILSCIHIFIPLYIHTSVYVHTHIAVLVVHTQSCLYKGLSALPVPAQTHPRVHVQGVQITRRLALSARSPEITGAVPAVPRPLGRGRALSQLALRGGPALYANFRQPGAGHSG